MSYARVIPRDLFNEGDLLNCLGRLSIKLDDDRRHKARLVFYGAGEQDFGIFQDDSDGSITASRVTFMINGTACRLLRPLNARDKWPLYCRQDDDDVRVFDLDGELSPEFWILIGGQH